MVRILLYALFFYFLYNFIVKVAFPVYKTTKQVKKQFSDMKQQFQQQEQPNTAGSGQPAANPSAAHKKEPAGEYIDFEEVT
ncbi:DUF4834 domain-containing protein [Niabella soli]|uniref:DUF4834 domain-containing protein n=1 Tax=Niabella soli DSM 19437 TaxID=929713 RepID=W0F4G3_9BACT|nr:DUF4834 domain-containing protein [Niabella soli]AHF17965.1 hypothetical protein NIASO_17800 [Niabella soli DSM 19437]